MNPSSTTAATSEEAGQPPSADAIDAVVASTQVKLVYERVPLSVLMTFGVVVLFTGLLSPFFSLRDRLTWLVVNLSIATCRYLLWRAYRRAQPEGPALKKWGSRFTYGAFAAGVGWAFGPMTMMPAAGHVESLLLVVTMLCVASVSTVNLTARLQPYVAFLATLMLLTGYALYRTGGEVEAIAAFVVMVGFIALLLAGRALNKTIRRMIRSEYKLSQSMSAMKLAQQDANRASEQLDSAIELLDAGFAVYDKNDRLVMCNSRYLNGLPHTLIDCHPTYAEMMQAYYRGGNDLIDRSIPEDEFVQAAVALRKALTHGSRVREALFGARWYRIQESRSLEGQIVVLTTDITLSKRITQDLSDAKDVAESASLAKTRFLANMSHELRTPLNAVIGAAQLLKAGTRDVESQTQMIEAIQKSGTNLLGLIEDILDLSRIEVGELHLSKEDFHLLDCIEAALATAALAARAKGLALACIVAPEVGAWRHGDPNRLRQILLNLLGNAIKFTPTGEIVLRIEVGARVDDLHISISDTGVGIGAASLPHIFEPFRQADDGANRRFGGSGLGLSIVYQLVKAQGGSITVQSELGKGTRFDIELSLPQAVSAPHEPATPGTLSARDGAASNVHVLVVEDDLLNQNIVCRLLKHAGYLSTPANDGAQALGLLAQKNFDLVLMDWQMPDMDGLEVTKRMRAGEAGLWGKTVPIVALTANAFAEDRAACMAAGMNEFLTKPVQVDRLMTTVRQWTKAAYLKAGAHHE